MPNPNPLRYSAAELALRIQDIVAGALGSSAQVGLELGPEIAPLRVTRWHYAQKLHELWQLEISASGAAIEDLPGLVWQGGSFWQRDGLLDFHVRHGRLRSAAEIGESADLCHYRFTLVPALAVLEFSRRLRPHYQGLLDAYRAEFKLNRGLRDPAVIEFFSKYVHDSVAGFDKDDTRLSDPRIIFVGGNNWLRYATIWQSVSR